MLTDVDLMLVNDSLLMVGTSNTIKFPAKLREQALEVIGLLLSDWKWPTKPEDPSSNATEMVQMDVSTVDQDKEDAMANSQPSEFDSQTSASSDLDALMMMAYEDMETKNEFKEQMDAYQQEFDFIQSKYERCLDLLTEKVFPRLKMALVARYRLAKTSNIKMSFGV
eukprot:TRINITY_DN4654_c0_g1_i1.p1 TRINITY_DN4654_c0_g1~~TRINITY_DN4654_c0_g1_i1.p1  ORF type:complete len:167 (-),score=51.83 TRINITY_DN4654_c0_g1_i1:150-650(-)